MTEKKRFEYKNHKVFDNLTGEEHSSNMVSVNVLNQLARVNREGVKKVQKLEKENEQLKKAEILANHRGEMISFANSLIDDLGSETMKEMWDKFREEKYEEWRNLE